MEDKDKTGIHSRNRKVTLSRRLQMLADMVTPGSRVADVGCDHGFLSIYLVQAGIAPRVLAMDVGEGPLQAAGKHIKEYGLEAYIETRLSDGLAACRAGEADTMVCAGMGGRLMERLLRQDMEQVRGMRELILQPQSELEIFRHFLRKTGFVTDREDMVEEGGKYYPAMRVYWQSAENSAEGERYNRQGINYALSDIWKGDADSKGNEYIPIELCNKFGEGLLRDRNPILNRYLNQQMIMLAELQLTLSQVKSRKARMRLEDIREERQAVEQALEYFCSNAEN